MKDLSHFPKTDIRFWQKAVFRQPYTVDGQRRLTKEWYARLQYGGKRQFFSLGTPNKAAAAGKARDIYLALISTGWESTLARYKGAKEFAQAKQRQQPCTVGDFLSEIVRTTSNQRTVEGYAKAFRQIVSQSFGLAAGTDKYDYRHGGQSKWLERVHSVKLTEVTPARIQEWKRSFLATAGNDPLELRRARISVNSLLRQARSVFAAKRLRHLQLSLPDPLPFDGVDFEPRQSMKYRSEIDVEALIKAAKAELHDSLPEAYKVFLLAVGAGLRKKEIDLLEWSSFRWEENVIRIEATRYFHPKSEDSIADLPVDREVMALFRGYYGRAKGPFVIKSRRAPLPFKPQQYYRCEPTFEQVNVWLRKAWSKRRQAAPHITERVRLSLNTRLRDSCGEPGPTARRLTHNLGTLQRFDCTGDARNRASTDKPEKGQGASEDFKAKITDWERIRTFVQSASAIGDLAQVHSRN